MACYYKCPVNNFVFLVHQVLQRDSLNHEYIRKFSFCSTTCFNNFKKNLITEDEDGYEYYNEVKNNEFKYCIWQMMEIVNKYKEKRRQIKMKVQELIHNEPSYMPNVEPISKAARLN
jgi:hypothetical protein